LSKNRATAGLFVMYRTGWDVPQSSKDARPMAIAIEPVHAITDDVRALIFELDSELAVAYPPEQMHGLTLSSLFEPHVKFFIARLDDVPMGCGGVAFFDDFAEVKRMYVRKSARGAGIAQALLTHIESVTRESGTTLLRLETGVRQPAAIRLYESFGFRSCASFPPYTTMAPAAIKNSMFFEKQLA
jgi:putative acetyltransferase